MVNKWDIWLCQLDPVLGSEQKGLRPVLVVSNDAINHNLPVSTIIPFSSVSVEDRIYPTEILLPTLVSGLPKSSVVMIHQLRTICHTRLVKKVSELTSTSHQGKILLALQEYFEC
jgi:mRNA interferase MazF